MITIYIFMYIGKVLCIYIQYIYEFNVFYTLLTTSTKGLLSC